jgi:hypothetical protein
VTYTASDGSASRAAFARMAPDVAKAIEGALFATFNAAIEGMVANGAPAPADPVLGRILSTALDRGVAALGATSSGAPSDAIVTAAVAGAVVGAVAQGGPTIGAVRHAAYRAGSMLGDAQAVASGSPAKMVQRAETHVLWRFLGRVFRRR